MDIIEVKSRKELKLFVNFPRKIYSQDSFWVPPIDIDIYERLNPQRHPFYKHGWAVKYLAVDNKNILGRILVSDDSRYNSENSTNQGSFGLFESINDQQVANALLDKAATVLRERGRDLIAGPYEYSTNYECGLLIDGFNYPPQMLMGHHLPYYQQLLENWGLQKDKDLYAWWFDLYNNNSNKWRPILEKLSVRYPAVIRSFRMNHFEDDVKECMSVYDCMRKEWWWSCVSLSPDEIIYYAKYLQSLVPSNQILLAEMDGQTVGFCIGIPNFNELFKAMNGKSSLLGIPYLGLLPLIWKQKKIQTGRIAVLCVLPEYRRKGIAERLILQILDNGCMAKHYKNAELSWTDEENVKINRIIEHIGAKKYKTYRVYKKDLHG